MQRHLQSRHTTEQKLSDPAEDFASYTKATTWQSDEQGSVKFRDVSPTRRLQSRVERAPPVKEKPKVRRAQSNPDVEAVNQALSELGVEQGRNSELLSKRGERNDGKERGVFHEELRIQKRRGSEKLLENTEHQKEFRRRSSQLYDQNRNYHQDEYVKVVQGQRSDNLHTHPSDQVIVQGQRSENQHKSRSDHQVTFETRSKESNVNGPQQAVKEVRSHRHGHRGAPLQQVNQSGKIIVPREVREEAIERRKQSSRYRKGDRNTDHRQVQVGNSHGHRQQNIESDNARQQTRNDFDRNYQEVRKVKQASSESEEYSRFGQKVVKQASSESNDYSPGQKVNGQSLHDNSRVEQVSNRGHRRGYADKEGNGQRERRSERTKQELVSRNGKVSKSNEGHVISPQESGDQKRQRQLLLLQQKRELQRRRVSYEERQQKIRELQVKGKGERAQEINRNLKESQKDFIDGSKLTHDIDEQQEKPVPFPRTKRKQKVGAISSVLRAEENIHANQNKESSGVSPELLPRKSSLSPPPSKSTLSPPPSKASLLPPPSKSTLSPPSKARSSPPHSKLSFSPPPSTASVSPSSTSTLSDRKVDTSPNDYSWKPSVKKQDPRASPELRVQVLPRFQKNPNFAKRRPPPPPVAEKPRHQGNIQRHRKGTGFYPENGQGLKHSSSLSNLNEVKTSESKKGIEIASDSEGYSSRRSRSADRSDSKEAGACRSEDNSSRGRGSARSLSSQSSHDDSSLSGASETLTPRQELQPFSTKSLDRQKKIVKFQRKGQLDKHKRLSQSQSNLYSERSSTPTPESSSLFTRIASQLDLVIPKVFSPRKGKSSPKDSSLTGSNSSSDRVAAEHRPQIRTPSYRPPSDKKSPNSSLEKSPNKEGESTDSNMYRRITTSYQRDFDDSFLKRRSVDMGRDGISARPQSAMFYSHGADMFYGSSPPGNFRVRSESEVDPSKLPGKGRSRSGDRLGNFERSPSPGLRSPNNGRSGRDRKNKKSSLAPTGGNMSRIPRNPRPDRMNTILENLKSGISDCIQVSQSKLYSLSEHFAESGGGGQQGIYYNLEKQIKAAERYVRKLEFHLTKVEELQEQYEKELKVREGAENILKAYAEVNSSKAKDSVNEARSSVKDCTQVMCQQEAELEANLGVFIMKIEGIAGFARVCRGDVFEISFKYGFQKWKSKCKVEKDLSQSWEGDEVVLYPMLGDYLQIKVTEIRGIGRSNVIIGSLEFDTSDFYQAEPQNLTIDINEAGTIKLNVVITWSPFQTIDEDYKTANKNSYGRRERALTEPSAAARLKPHSMVAPMRSDPLPISSLPSTHPMDSLDDVPILTLAEALHNVQRLLEILNGQYVELKTLEQQVASLDTYLKKSETVEPKDSIEDALDSFNFLKSETVEPKDSIKDALDSFNFLNEVDEGLSDNESEDLQSNSSNKRNSQDLVPKSKSLDHLTVAAKLEKEQQSQQQLSMSKPDLHSLQRHERSSAKRSSRFLDLTEKRESRVIELNEQRGGALLDSPTADSSFGSMGRSSYSVDPDSEPLTTGHEAIDMTLVQHLMYTEYQLSHLGAFGPLKLKERIALEKLQKQAVIIEQLMKLATQGLQINHADDVLPELKLNPRLLDFWEMCKEKQALYVNADSFLLQLDVKFGAKLRTNHPDIADDVFQSLGHRIIERPIDLLDPKAIITLFQYITFFAQEDRKNPEAFIQDLTNEFELTASLETGHQDLPKIIKKLPKGTLLPAGNLRALGLLLLEESEDLKHGVKSYLESIASNPKLRPKVVHVFSECLEERDLSLRQAGCVALAAMGAREALDQLVYLLQCDMDDVKQTVKECLMTFGEEGRRAYASLSYPSYAGYPPHFSNKSEGPLITTEL